MEEERKTSIIEEIELQHTVLGDGSILIEPLFDSRDPQLCPDKLDFKSLIKEIHETPTYWPRDVVPLGRISADYGRSHYFFTDGKDTISRAVHKYCFKNEGNVTDKERIAFFEDLDIRGEDIPQGCDSPSPTRANIITRVKYELLKRFLEEKGKKSDESEKLALLAMYLTTQDFLGWVKHRSSRVLEKLYPALKFYFVFFQSNVNVVDGVAVLNVSFINHKPKYGAWQAKMGLPSDNKKNMLVKFQYNLEKDSDMGKVIITIGKKHSKYKKRINRSKKEKFFGIYNTETRTSIKFCDTLPTW